VNKIIAGDIGAHLYGTLNRIRTSSVIYLALCLLFTTLHDQNYSRTLRTS